MKQLPPISLLVLFVVGIGLSACSSPDTEPSPFALIGGINLNEKQMEALMAKAQNGDARAALDLGHHFAWVAYDDERAKYWYRRAADLGGEKEQGIYKAFMEPE